LDSEYGILTHCGGTVRDMRDLDRIENAQERRAHHD
jgi:hypothetical protein